jgi:hypothetical protein
MHFVDPSVAAVAYLSRTVSWRGGQVTSRPRLQPLDVPAGTAVMAVIRLESRGTPLPDAAAVAAEVLKDAARPSIRAVQIDFDARASERGWYTQLLQQVRRRLNPSKPLTMTALASWCMGDPWVRSLPVSDAVPMLFRMGAGEPREVREFSVAMCRSSVGISTDELPYAVPRGRRLFIFNPRAWSPDVYREALQFARRWK